MVSSSGVDLMSLILLKLVYIHSPRDESGHYLLCYERDATIFRAEERSG